MSQRSSISAEVYGLWNIKKAYEPKIIPKTEDQANKIRLRLKQAFMFASLEDRDLEIVINAMEIKNFM